MATLGVPAAAVVAAVVAGGAWAAWKYVAGGKLPPPSAEQPTRGNPDDPPLRLYDFPACRESSVASSVSPFVGKVETVLRIAGIEYTKRQATPPKAPRGTLPFICHGPHTVADSACILRYLRATYPDNAKLQALFTYATPQEQGVAVAVQALLDNRLFWLLLPYRWFEPAGYERNVAVFGGMLERAFGAPRALVRVLMARQRRSFWERADGQGLGRLAPSEQSQAREEAVEALAGLLGDKPFFTGAEPKALDAAVFAWMDICLHDGIALPARELVLRHANLTAFVERVRAAYYSPA